MTHARIFYQVSVPATAAEEFCKLAAQMGARIQREYKRRKVTPEDQAEMRRLFTEEGIPSAVIGERFGLSPASMSQYLRGYKRKKAPKEAKPKRQVGRPPLTEDEKQVRIIVNPLLAHYDKLKVQYAREPEDYEKYFAPEERCLRLAVKEQDLPTIRWFESNHPWINRTAVMLPPNLSNPQPEEATPTETSPAQIGEAING